MASVRQVCRALTRSTPAESVGVGQRKRDERLRVKVMAEKMPL
jgi:hypothetical protein